MVNEYILGHFRVYIVKFFMENRLHITLWSKRLVKHTQRSAILFICSLFLLHPVVLISAHFLFQVSKVQMHESGSEPTSLTIPASQTENGNTTENESRLRSSQTPPPEAPRVSHSQLCPHHPSAKIFKTTKPYKCWYIRRGLCYC